MAEIATNGDGRKATVSQQLINNLKAELNKVKADLADELDRLNADAEKLRAFNASHRHHQQAPTETPAAGTARQLINHLKAHYVPQKTNYRRAAKKWGCATGENAAQGSREPAGCAISCTAVGPTTVHKTAVFRNSA